MPNPLLASRKPNRWDLKGRRQEPWQLEMRSCCAICASRLQLQARDLSAFTQGKWPNFTLHHSFNDGTTFLKKVPSVNIPQNGHYANGRCGAVSHTVCLGEHFVSGTNELVCITHQSEVQGASKKMHHSDFSLKSVPGVGFHFSRGFLESEFRARNI